MTTGRRLLSSAGSSSGSSSPAFDVLRMGYWNQQSEPRAAYYNGKTYLVWITAANTIEIAAWDHGTRRLGPAYTIASGVAATGPDVHNSVAVCVRASDRKIVVAYCEQDATAMKVRISSSAEDVSAFGSVINVGSGGDYTYVLLYQLTAAVNQPLYLFSQTGHAPAPLSYDYSVSTDGGATWSSMTPLISPKVGADGLYCRIGVRDGNKLDIYATDTVSTEAEPSNLYHLVFNGTTLFKSDGTSLGTTFPVRATSGTLIQSNTLGTVRALGWSVADSKPATIFTIYDTATPTLLIRVARWTGSAWRVDPVTDSNGLVLGTSRMSECAIDKSNPDVCYVSKRVGPTYWEMLRYVTPDSGSTWSESFLTTGSTDHNANPDTPLDAGQVRVLWGYGAGTSLDFVVRASLT